ncbi:hypothetical protein D9758_010449 [Tetrapyrgos nigripes]|uniref:Uncharacterized protein n=1 Tax=Tetrapyrgos nigripes TaxID=182062 RepID=A0A8H5FPQ1_9AGAR|nr:hypothetical protein D9758_010449 [Tetrapyrgos nigripes]
MQLKLNKTLIAVTVMLITTIRQSAAQECSSSDDCPGTDVCCIIGSGFCIRFDQCVNVEDNGFGQCTIGGPGGVAHGLCG